MSERPPPSMRAAHLRVLEGDLLAIAEKLRGHELLDLELRAVELSHAVGAAARDDEPTAQHHIVPPATSAKEPPR